MIRYFALMLLALASQSQAVECDIESFNFSNSDCSFSLPFEAKQLKFGNLDAVTSSGNAIRIGVVRFNLADEIEVFDAAEPSCNYYAGMLGDEQEGQEIAFKVSETNSREITQVWLLNCTVGVAR